MNDDFLCMGRFLGLTGLAAGGFLSLTAFQAEGGGGALRAQILKKPAHAPRHFDRSGAEWRNLLPLMVRATLGREISRLRVSSERLPSAPYRHAAPLEMTVAASAPIVISTEAKRSREISLLNSPGSIGAGDLSTQSIIGAFSICPIPTRSPARDDDGGERPYRHFDRSGAEWRNLLPLMVRAALGREISRLRVSSERLPSVSHTDTQPRSR